MRRAVVCLIVASAVAVSAGWFSAAAAPGDLVGGMPRLGGVALVFWGGGTTDQLAAVAGGRGCNVVSAWVTVEGQFVGYVYAAPAFVNSDFVALYPGSSIRPDTPMALVCRAGTVAPPPPPAPTAQPSATAAAPSQPCTAALCEQNPAAFGSAVTTPSGWVIAVVSVTPNATQQVMAENRFNDPPAAGRQFFIARIRATYQGTGYERFDGTYRLRAIGAARVSYSTFQDSCGVIPDRISDAEVASGGTVEGNVCWSVRTGDASRLVMYDDPLLGDDRDRRWFALFR